MEEFFCSRFISLSILNWIEFFLFCRGQPSAVARHPGEYPADETSQRADTTTPGIQLAIITFSAGSPLFFPSSVDRDVHSSIRPSFYYFFLFLALRAEMGGKNNLMDDGGRWAPTHHPSNSTQAKNGTSRPREEEESIESASYRKKNVQSGWYLWWFELMGSCWFAFSCSLRRERRVGHHGID